jgi:hypothetical protein
MLKIQNDTYSFLGTQDGRVLQYFKKDGSFISRVFSFRFALSCSPSLLQKQKVYALAQENELLCASGYGGEIIFTNIYTRAKKTQVFHSKSTVCSLVFLDEKYLAASNVNGEVYVYNIQTFTYKKYTTTKRNIQGVIHLRKENILLVYAKDNSLTLIDLQREQLLEHNFMIFNAIIKQIEREEKGFLISFTDQTQEMISEQEIKLKLELLYNEISKKANSGYLTKMQKSIQTPSTQTSNNPKSYKILQDAYAKNDFKLCYEIIDRYELTNTQLCSLLQKHWKKLIVECESFALQGDAKKILSSLGELLFIESRSDILGDLLRLSFYKKISMLQEEKNYTSAQNIIYSYVDIFGYDCEIAQEIKKFEQVSRKKIAILTHKEDRKSRTFWWEYFHQAI